jgi:hypothetical protein
MLVRLSGSVKGDTKELTSNDLAEDAVLNESEYRKSV